MKCYHFDVGRSAAALLLLAALAAGCRGSMQPVDNSDPAVKARVEAALRGRDDFELRYVSVDCTNGLVTVSGLVPEHRQVREIDRLVKRVPGVRGAMINLAVQE